MVHATTVNQKGEKNELDHNRFVPVPKEIYEVMSGSDEMFYEAWYGDCSRILDYPWVKAAGVTNREQLQNFLQKREMKYGKDAKAIADKYKYNLDNFGCTNWYDWNCQNLGTKWGICNPVINEINFQQGYVSYNFESAWSPAVPVIQKMSELFPNLKFELDFYEVGMGFKGTIHFKAGEETKCEEGKYYGERGG